MLAGMNEGIMQTLGTIIRLIDTVCAIIAEGLVFLLMLLVTAEIIGRRVLGSPIPGQVEAATLSLVLILYLGVAYTQLEGGHIRVELLVSRVMGHKRELIDILTLLLSLFVSVLMLWSTAKQARISVLGKEFVSGIISFPVWPGRCAVAFGFAILSITLVIQICSHLIAVLSVRKRDGEK
jgi:TRAP-type C4-dicarboxylate transport system permease small subunit